MVFFNTVELNVADCCRHGTTGKPPYGFPEAPCQAHVAKIIVFPKFGNRGLTGAIPPARGALRDRHDSLVRDAMGAPSRKTFGMSRTVKPCGPVPSTLGSSSWTISRATVAKKPETLVGTPVRARISRKNHCAGSAGSFRWTCGDYARVLSTLHARLRVRSAPPGIPCALSPGRDEVPAKPGRRSRRGNTGSCFFERTASQVRQSEAVWNMPVRRWYMQSGRGKRRPGCRGKRF